MEVPSATYSGGSVVSPRFFQGCHNNRHSTVTRSFLESVIVSSVVVVARSGRPALALMGLVRVSDFVQLFKGLQRWGSEGFLMVFLKLLERSCPKHVSHRYGPKMPQKLVVYARIRTFS